MKVRDVVHVGIGMALLLGTAGGSRRCLAQMGPVGHAPLPTLDQAINGGMPEFAPGTSHPGQAPSSRSIDPSRVGTASWLRQIGPPGRAPVGHAPLPSLVEAINGGNPGASSSSSSSSSGSSLSMPPASSLPVMLPAPPSLPPLPQERSGAMLAPPSDPLLVPAGSPGQDFGPPPPISTSAPEPAILSPSPRTVAAPPLSPPPATAPAPAVASDPAPPTGSAMPLPPLPGDGAGTPNPTAIQSRVDSGQLLGLTVATVGTEVVSLVELQDAVREWQRVNVPKGQALTREQVNQIASGMLEQLIDRAIFIEEAKRVLLKSEKQRKAFDEFINKQWKEKEIPILVRRYDLKNETALRDHLERQGRSLELLLERYRKETMAREFLHNQLAQRLVKPEVRELWSYYRDHPAEFQRGAKVTWRELTIKSGPTLDRAAARAQAAELMEQIARGADFATVAKARSHGSTAPKGGLWETSPGASASPAVNQALDALPIGQLSGLLEAPDGFHVVRVEDRRAAGPADFSEVQEEIRSKIQAELFQREAEAFTKRLREQTLITYHIKNPRESKRDGQAERAAAGPPSSSSSSSPGP